MKIIDLLWKLWMAIINIVIFTFGELALLIFIGLGNSILSCFIESNFIMQKIESLCQLVWDNKLNSILILLIVNAMLVIAYILIGGDIYELTPSDSTNNSPQQLKRKKEVKFWNEYEEEKRRIREKEALDELKRINTNFK
ncbi:MAG: hypothetical protein HFG28_07165 [Eubacterium sp.]|nr:hypothetical protein [Eubacterium sp.]